MAAVPWQYKTRRRTPGLAPSLWPPPFLGEVKIIQQVLQSAGVEFIEENGDGRGVRLPEPARGTAAPDYGAGAAAFGNNEANFWKW